MLLSRAMGEKRADQSELFIGLVAAVGTDVGMIADQLAIQLDEYGFTGHILRLSDYLAEQADTDFREKPFDEALADAMTAGDELRRKWQRDDALALHAISDIAATRESLADPAAPSAEEGLPANLDRYAFIIRSLKTPGELETLRSVYGPQLIVIGAYSPKEMRVKHLAAAIADSRKTTDRRRWAYRPEELIERDEREEETGGQDVSGTFHRADFFVRGWNRDVAEPDLRRTLEILFGSPFRTPTRDEYGQFMAAGAGRRSAEFGRQVGAAISDAGGSIIALGTNEVPKFGGGSHWEEDGHGNRDFEVGDMDSNRRQFDELAERLAAETTTELARLLDAHVEAPDERERVEAVLAELQEKLPATLRAGGLEDLTEFGRAVHAEMSALMDAVARGVAVAGGTLHVTTFPCHNCARHILGAGIQRVVFIEPYEKTGRGSARGVGRDRQARGGFERRELDGPRAVCRCRPWRYLEMFGMSGRERRGPGAETMMERRTSSSR